jgi:periplasmic protein TonB
MFRETLLESAPGARRRKRWPMILAVALEVTVCSVLVAVPLFSTGIIASVSATPPVILPRLEPVPIVHDATVSHDSGRGPVLPHTSIVPFADGKPHINYGRPMPEGNDEEASVSPNLGFGPSGPGLPACDPCLPGTRPRGPEHTGPHKVSAGVSEGYLFHRVDPVYPRMALLTGTSGEVRLHAIISKDGVIESLTLISGHPLLAKAAMDAVQQWRYRPYLLNHEPVEVETLITVNFTPGH